MTEEKLTLKDSRWLSERLGLSISTVEKLRAEGSQDIPPHIKIGSSIRYDEAMVEQWLADKIQFNTSQEIHHGE